MFDARLKMPTLRPRTAGAFRKNGSAGPTFIMSVQVVGTIHQLQPTASMDVSLLISRPLSFANLGVS